MDIQHLVDRLEDLIDEGRHMPFSKFTLVDEERALEIIDQMRISIPEEIEKAARILAQRDRVLAQANEEAARILQNARQKGDQLLEQDVNVQAAQNHAVNVVEQARQKAAQIMADADNYIMQLLSRLEQNLVKNLNQVRNGINELAQAPSSPIETGQVSAYTYEVEEQSTPAQFPTRSQVEISLKRASDVEQQ